jgi:hypothetical protein
VTRSLDFVQRDVVFERRDDLADVADQASVDGKGTVSYDLSVLRVAASRWSLHVVVLKQDGARSLIDNPQGD